MDNLPEYTLAEQLNKLESKVIFRDLLIGGLNTEITKLKEKNGKLSTEVSVLENEISRLRMK